MKSALAKCSLTAAALLLTFSLQLATCAAPFEGRLTAMCVRGGENLPLLYTVGTNFLRVEVAAGDLPNPVDVVDRHSGGMTLLYPHNRSFVRLKPAADVSSSTPPSFPPLHAGLRPGIGPQSQPPGPPARPNGLPPGIGPTNLPGVPALPNPPGMAVPPPRAPAGFGAQAPPPVMPGAPMMRAMPNMPVGGGMPAMPMMPMPGDAMELKATGAKTNLLGFLCEKFEIKQRGETLEIWATDQLFPFQNYVRNQPPRFGPRMLEEQWPGLLAAKKLFPLRASLRFDNGTERYHFEVKTITPEKLTDRETKLFQPPAGYTEIEPLPF